MAAATTIIPIRWCAVATGSCRSTSMSRAARRPPKHCSTASCCCRRRSSAAATSPADPEQLTGMDDKLKDLAEYLSAALPGAVIASEISHGELTCRVARDALLRVLGFLRDDPRCRFTMLCDICGVDHPDRAERFDVVYHLLSMTLNRRIRIKLETDEEQPVASAVGLYS